MTRGNSFSAGLPEVRATIDGLPAGMRFDIQVVGYGTTPPSRSGPVIL